MQLGEFFIALGFDVDDQKLKSFNDEIKDGWKGLLKLSAIAAGSVYAINRFVAGGVAAATALRNFNNETGNSIEGLQKWQVASVLTNAAMTADQVTSSFRAMASSIADVTMGKGNAGAFAMLGIDDVRGADVSDVMEELRANFDQNVSRWGLLQTINLMSDIGFDAGMLNALKMTNKEFNDLAANKFLSPEAREKLVDLGNALSKFKLEFNLFKDQLSADWSPRLISIIEAAIPVFKEFAANIGAVYSEIKTMLGGLASENLDVLVVMAGIIFAAFNPVLTLFAALAFAVNDFGKSLRGLPTQSEEALKWMQEQTQFLDPLRALTHSIREKLGLGDPMFGEGSKDFYARISAPAGGRAASNENYNRSNETTLNNTYNIQSNADALSLSELIMMRQKQMLEGAQAELGNGALR